MRAISYVSQGRRERREEMPQESESLKVGNAAPGFCLPEGPEGEEVCLEDYRGHKLLLMFLRGSW
jgi:hypothetical protein